MRKALSMVPRAWASELTFVTHIKYSLFFINLLALGDAV